ncbi:DUF2634 domain-containing protein [Psychrobacillus sp. FSL K6-2365]|uniref:DUF2634 domain-containing protein n=1 Tax=Psychrobacillus sp. FSL K6-2365 TaxID=2921546 RepID=UPI0030F641F4
MAIIPQSLEEAELEVVEIEVQIEPSLTYSLLPNSIGGKIDGLEAIRQFIAKAIKTARDRFLIYDDQYGCDLESLIGANVTRELLDEEIPRVITEALIYDDRISDVVDFVITNEDDKVFVSFTVLLVNGEQVESEVEL